MRVLSLTGLVSLALWLTTWEQEDRERALHTKADVGYYTASNCAAQGRDHLYTDQVVMGMSRRS